MSKNPNTPLPLTPNTDDITYINFKEGQPKQNVSETEAGDFNMDVYATLGERNPEEINTNPTYENLPKRQNEKSFLAKNKWKIFIAGAVIVILMVQCIIIGLASGGVFQDIVECSSNPCQNGGSCVDGVNSYNCMCARGHWGVKCDAGYQAEISYDGLTFGSAYANKSSPEYRKLADETCAEIDKTYAATALNDNYQSCTVTDMKNGSVIVIVLLVFKADSQSVADKVSNTYRSLLVAAIVEAVTGPFKNYSANSLVKAQQITTTSTDATITTT